MSRRHRPTPRRGVRNDGSRDTPSRAALGTGALPVRTTSRPENPVPDMRGHTAAPTLDDPVPDNRTYARPDAETATEAATLPVAALLVMALVGFLLIATETMPAGLLPQIAAGMDVTEGLAGQYVSAYALGTVVAAIPAVA